MPLDKRGKKEIERVMFTVEKRLLDLKKEEHLQSDGGIPEFGGNWGY